MVYVTTSLAYPKDHVFALRLTYVLCIVIISFIYIVPPYHVSV